MANLAATTVTGALNVTSTITGPASGASALNASNVSSGTLDSARLPTVPTSKGGTGLTSVGSTGQVLTVTGPGALAFETPAGGGGCMLLCKFTSPGTYTKPASVNSVKVTVIGGGGGSVFTNNQANDPTYPQTIGGTSSFGSCASATGGRGDGPHAKFLFCVPGVGSSGDLNGTGSRSNLYDIVPGTYNQRVGGSAAFSGGGGDTFQCQSCQCGAGGVGNFANPGPGDVGWGANGAGGAIKYLSAPALASPVSVTVGSGGSALSPGPRAPNRRNGNGGVVIVEEFY